MPSSPSVHEARRRLRDILRRAEKLGVPRTSVARLPAVRRLRGLTSRRRSPSFLFLQQGSGWVLLITAAACASLAALFFCYSGGSPLSGSQLPDAARQQQYQTLVSFFLLDASFMDRGVTVGDDGVRAGEIVAPDGRVDKRGS